MNPSDWIAILGAIARLIDMVGDSGVTLTPQMIADKENLANLLAAKAAELADGIE